MAMRVLVVDDHEVVRLGMRMLLRSLPEFEYAGEAWNGREAIKVASLLQPDIILMDVMMPEMDGITATRAIVEQHPHIRVMALTSQKDEPTVYAMIDAGAAGYVFKDAPYDELVNSLKAVQA